MEQAATDAQPTSKRLIFIDALRAFAILMMLQGHFIDSLLAEAYRVPESAVFSAWSFMRGLTAPIFFTASGIIFVFLLLRDGRPLGQNLRVKKGIKRGWTLIALGYILKLNLFALILFRFYDSFITVDVLHCIGIAILILIGAYALSKRFSLPFPLLLVTGGVGIFLLYPYMSRVDWSFLPVFLQNFVDLTNGSVFTPVPWVGFTLIGGLFGWHIHRHTSWYLSIWPGVALCAAGYWLHFSSTQGLRNLYEITHWEVFVAQANNNWLFWRLGHVLIVIAIFTWAAKLFYRYIPKLFLTIGSETLTIYSVHYVLLYGTWTGIGIVRLVGYRSLGPLAAAIGAVLFVAAFVLLVHYLEPIRAWLDKVFYPRVIGFWQTLCSKWQLPGRIAHYFHRFIHKSR
ncbi:MAG: heparan-alpha-glucosaminide N-acetyltransferase domain-containing protein [Saprospiraceae bacterium]